MHDLCLTCESVVTAAIEAHHQVLMKVACQGHLIQPPVLSIFKGRNVQGLLVQMLIHDLIVQG